MDNPSTQAARDLTITQFCRRYRVPYNTGYNAVLRSGLGYEDPRGRLLIPEADVPAIAARAGLPAPQRQPTPDLSAA